MDDLLYALDPAIWARDVLGIDLDGWQQDVLRSSRRNVLLNCSRQAGKSTVAAIKAAHYAVYRPGTLTLLASPTLRQSGELYRKVTAILDALTSPLSYDEDTRTGLTLTNGSRVVSLPGSEKTIRGFSAVNLLLEDEAARVLDEAYYAARPMLAVSGGTHVLMSTPWGRRGHFFEAWDRGGDAWERYMVTAYDVPRIDQAFLEQERRELGPLWFKSEYECKFTETVDNVFSFEDIEAAVSDNILPLFERTSA